MKLLKNTLRTSIHLNKYDHKKIMTQLLSVSLLGGGSPFWRRSRSFSLSLRSCERERGEWWRRSLERERDRLCLDRRVRELDRDLLRFGDLEKKKDIATHHKWALKSLSTKHKIDGKEQIHSADILLLISDAYLEPECDRRPCLPSLIDERSISIDRSWCGVEKTCSLFIGKLDWLLLYI